jgi:hypothetical protein
MITLLEQAVAKARDLPPSEQDALASLMLEEIEADQKWDELFARSPDQLQKIADRAWAEHEAGKTLPLDPDNTLVDFEPKVMSSTKDDADAQRRIHGLLRRSIPSGRTDTAQRHDCRR